MHMMDPELPEAIEGIFDRKLDQKLAKQKQDILKEGTHNMMVLIESHVTPQLKLLAEGQQAILERLLPRSRADDLEEVRFPRRSFSK